MIVTNDTLHTVVEDVLDNTLIGFDTETYGLDFGKKMFSMQLATESNAYYINFHNYQREDVPVLDRASTLSKLAPIFDRAYATWFIHNAKYDLHRLAYENVELKAKTHCTEVIERLIYNQHMSYSLENCVARHGLPSKDDAVEKWIRENKAYSMVKLEGKSKSFKDKHYWKVPFELMYEYGLQDAKIVRDLGILQLEMIEENDVDTKLYENECRLVKDLLKMEMRGVLVDREYALQGWKYEEHRKKEQEDCLGRLGGSKFKNGPKWLASVFDSQGVSYRINPKTRNPIFDKSALDEINHPIAAHVREYRRSDKYISTYYSDFVHNVDSEGAIHANIRQAGTDTGRFSYSNPNLQNVPKEEDFEKGQVQVRKCFVPREGYTFVAIDYRQQEFRLMLDYAKERKVIEAVMDGKDLHQATADMVGVTRKQAKTLNFGLLYGMGTEKLAHALKISVREAADIKFMYFDRLPKVENFIINVQATAKRRKYIRTWANRRLHFPNREWCYKAPNHLIQGGCGDMARFCITKISEQIKGKPVHLIIQVHDELIFEIRNDALGEIPSLVETMKTIYTPMAGMYMDCSVETSTVSWGQQDMTEEENE